MTRQETEDFAKVWLSNNWTTFNPGIREGLFDFFARCLTDFAMSVNQPMRTLTKEEMERFKDHPAIRGTDILLRDPVYIPYYEPRCQGMRLEDTMLCSFCIHLVDGNCTVKDCTNFNLYSRK